MGTYNFRLEWHAKGKQAIQVSVHSCDRSDEMGRYDLPAVVNYILKRTGQPKLIFIGHSMGAAIFYIAVISHPELNDKIEMMIAMAPTVSFADYHTILRPLSQFVNQFEVMSKVKIWSNLFLCKKSKKLVFYCLFGQNCFFVCQKKNLIMTH